MITFKQYLHEEDETDQEHEHVQAAAMEYMKHCSQFPDINHPLYRLSGSSWNTHNHKLKTRVPRTRITKSLGGTAEEQEFLFSMPGWEDYPPRRQSIFCSTTKNFAIDDPSDDGSNLLMIFPFDGVKIAVLPENDLNMMNILRGMSNKMFRNIDDLFEPIDRAYTIFYGTGEDNDADGPKRKLVKIKKAFQKNGKFNPEANGNDELADKYAEWERDDDYREEVKSLRMVATEYPEKLTPQAMGVKLVKSRDLDLPGDTREVWFSGKYLSVPYRYFEEFKKAVDLLEADKYHDDNEPPED